MTTNPLGQGVSRYTDGRDKQLGGVVFQAGKPPLDSELNLISLIELEARAEAIRSSMPSGWLMNESNPRADYSTNPNYSNQFYFGRQTTGEVRNLTWAAVNGWMVPVAGTKTGAPPLAANDSETWNRILLNPPSTSTGGNRAEFVFLEVWLQRIDVDPAAPGIASGKPQRGYIYRYGNVEGGFSYIADDLVDPDINFETTGRVQLQYRLRVVADINLAQYPEGFDPTLVFAQGSLTSASAVPFANMRQELGDAGLWRAGTGDPATFGTVDGYVYAVPVCAVFRRNAAAFSDVGNLAGSFNRNSSALNRSGARAFTADVTLPIDIIETDVSFDLTSISGTILQTITNFGEAYFKIDDEIVRVTSVTQNSPTSFTIDIDRGQLQTIVRAHKSGTKLVPYTVRPDGLFADQIAITDILDLRHSVAPKFDYDSILQTGLTELMKGNLRTTWKRYGSTNSAGPVILYGDRITDSSVFVGGLTRLDGPDGNRRVYSDAVSIQRFNVPVAVPTNSASLNNPQHVSVAPYNVTVTWTGHPPSHGPGQRLNTVVGPPAGSYPSWWNGDQLTIAIDNFRNGLPSSDANQVRFINPDDEPDAVIIRFEGMTTDPNGGDPTVSTSPTASHPNLTIAAPSGTQKILKHGEGIDISFDAFDNMVITFQSGTVDTVLNEFVHAMQDNVAESYALKLVMHVEFGVLYGAGRGLSHKPDFIHTVQFRGSSTNASKVMLRGGLSDKNRMIPTYLCDSPYVQTGNNRALSRTSEVMIDPGSKTVYVAPYRNVLIPSLLCRNGSQLNWYGSTPTYQGAMPTLSQDGLSTVHTTVDPLDLFMNGSQTRYVEIPMEYLPRPGLHHIPLQPITSTVFPSGLNFLLMSKEGPNSDTSDYNVDLIQYPSGASGYYIATPYVGETYGTSSGSYTMFGQKYSNVALRAASGGPFRGIKFPPFLAPARITGVYARAASAGPGYLTPTSTPFDNNRVFVGGVGTDTNLLKDSYDGPTVLLDVNEEGDLFFILNSDALDLSRISSSATFDNTEFLVECTLFAFDRGFLQTNGRLCIAKLGAGGSGSMPVNTFTTTSDNVVGIIVPAPMATDASNNELTVYYTREPYQGDVFGTQSAYSDDPHRLGPLTVSEASGLHDSPLGNIQTLTLPNRTGFEVLAATSFVTSLGTGRMSGPAPLPLLNKVEAPNNPEDFSGTWVDIDRKYSLHRVGYEDWATPKFPVSDAAFAERPAIKMGALSEVYDHDIHQEFAGCVSRLPLGAYFRDKDFVGKTLWQSRSISGIGSISLGSLAFVDYKASMTQGVSGHSTWEGTEFVCGNSSGTAGVGSEAIIKVDGTSNPTSTTVFKTTRGGAAYSATGPWPGGVLSARFPKARPNIEAGSVLMGTAYLVRSQPEAVGSAEVHMGSELQLIVVTHAVPAYFRDTDSVHSASGTNEGFTAVDRFRIPGRPLEKRRGSVDTTIAPTQQPVFINKIYDNPLFFGSSDVPLTAQKQEILAVTSNGQTSFTLSTRPLDPAGVQLFHNGVKLAYGVNYSVSGVTNQTVTYVPSSSAPAIALGDTLEVWYLLF